MLAICGDKATPWSIVRCAAETPCTPRRPLLRFKSDLVPALTRMPCPPCKIELLRTLPLLSLLSDEQLDCISMTLRRRSYPPRAFVVCAGDTTEGLYFILSGKLHVVHEDGDAREVIIAALGPNEFFGESSLFHPAARLQSVQAQDACEILFLPKAPLLQT